MGLEVTTTIAGLVATNPVASDAVGQADDHLRLLKNVLKTIFPGAGGSGFSTPLTVTEAELNYVHGVTSAIQTQLNTISAAAATADGKAVTADGKAVAAQADATTALANAATADGKAVTALANAATADAKAVTAQAMAADAWANFAGSTGAISKQYNVASVTKPSGNQYAVTFTNAMPNANYSILCSSTDAVSIFYVAGSLTTTGFTLQTNSASATNISFAVFAVA